MISTLLTFLSILSILSLGSACDFNGLIASCPMVIGGHHVQVSAMINHCHTPIDISFLVMGSNDRMPEAHNTEQNLRHRPLYWHYTFVTTNQPESRELPGYGQRVMLHMSAKTRTEIGGHSKRIQLKAQFLVDGHTNEQLTFIDDDVRIPHFEDCAYTNNESQVGSIAIGCILTIIVLCFLGLAGLYVCRPNKDSEDEVDLVRNMERGGNSSSSLASSRPHQPNMGDFNVHYIVPKPHSSNENSDELNVYISTSNGLQKVERRSSQNSNDQRSSSSSSSSQSSGQNSPISQGSSGGNPSSNNESRADPTSSSKASNKMEHPLQDLEDRHEDRTSLSMSEQALDTSRALGAIPKHSRQLQSTLLTL